MTPSKDDYLKEYLNDNDLDTAEFIEKRINDFIILFENNDYGISVKRLRTGKVEENLIPNKKKAFGEA